MILLILPLFGVILMVVIISSNGNAANESGNSEARQGRPTPRPITLVPPTTSPTLPVPATQPAVTNQIAPDLPLNDLNGRSFTLADFRGQLVVLNFWATWCTPCREEMPILQAFSDAQGEDGVLVLAITEPTNGQDMEKIRAFLDEMQITLPIGLDQSFSLHNALGVVSLPMTFFIDKEGMVRQFMLGQLTLEDLQRETNALDPQPF